GGCGAGATNPPTDPPATCPLCRLRPADCLAVCACNDAQRFGVCGRCLDVMERQSHSWGFWAHKAGLVPASEVPDLDDDEDDDDTDGDGEGEGG
ncbi:MAG TPA: hypothetical protein VFW33_13760, partial [Gemmataceae bacterium]|nr:hypothetical protein [Gemmataceae bacterium]